MLKTLQKIKLKFPEVKYKKSEESLENMLQAAHIILASNDRSKLTARELAKVSGYSNGGIVKRSGSIENIFLHAIAKERTEKMKEAGAKLFAAGPNATAHEISKLLVDYFFEGVSKIGVEILKYYESRAIGRTKKVSDVHAYTDECLPTFKKIISTNKTNTFREVDDFELKYILRVMFLLLEQPLIEGHPKAGSQAHKDMAVDLFTRLISRATD